MRAVRNSVLSLLLAVALAGASSGVATAAPRTADWGLEINFGDGQHRTEWGHDARYITIRSTSEVDGVGVGLAQAAIELAGTDGSAYVLPATFAVSVDGPGPDAFAGKVIQADMRYACTNPGTTTPGCTAVRYGTYDATLRIAIPGHWACPQYDPEGCRWYEPVNTTRHYQITYDSERDTRAAAMTFTASASATEAATTRVSVTSQQKAKVSRTAKASKKWRGKAYRATSKRSATASASATRAASATRSATSTATARAYTREDATAQASALATADAKAAAGRDAEAAARRAATSASTSAAKTSAQAKAARAAKKLATKAAKKAAAKKVTSAKARAKARAKAASRASASGARVG